MFYKFILEFAPAETSDKMFNAQLKTCLNIRYIQLLGKLDLVLKLCQLTFHDEILDNVHSVVNRCPVEKCDVFGVALIDVVTAIFNLYEKNDTYFNSTNKIV